MSINQNIGGLAEIALRVNDLKAMSHFYEYVVGLEVMSRDERMTFFKIAEGFAGHTQILALFDRSQGRLPTGQTTEKPYVAPASDHSTVDHIAFSIAKENFVSEKERLQTLGMDVVVSFHEWVQWRSLYIFDPEGNSVEFVCYDPQ